MSNYLKSAVVACAALLTLGAFPSPQLFATQVDLLGDLGNNSWTGALFSPINSTTTTSFTHTLPGVGSIAGDLIATNTGGTTFDLVVTNLTYTVVASPNTNNLTDVLLTFTHDFMPLTLPNVFFSSHSLSGTWSTNPLHVVQLESWHDPFGNNIQLPSLSDTNTLSTTTFNLGPAGTLVPVPVTSGVYTIHAHLRLRMDGTGTIMLPTSADINVQAVPETASAALLLLGGALWGCRSKVTVWRLSARVGQSDRITTS